MSNFKLGRRIKEAHQTHTQKKKRSTKLVFHQNSGSSEDFLIPDSVLLLLLLLLFYNRPREGFKKIECKKKKVPLGF